LDAALTAKQAESCFQRRQSREESRVGAATIGFEFGTTTGGSRGFLSNSFSSHDSFSRRRFSGYAASKFSPLPYTVAVKFFAQRRAIFIIAVASASACGECPGNHPTFAICITDAKCDTTTAALTNKNRVRQPWPRTECLVTTAPGFEGI
jgi:hypothetical protein